jgi:hypothetical protein
MRVLGSRFEVIGDEERASPKPGETLRVSFATVFPDLDQNTDESQLMMLACTAPTRYTGGLPICQELLDVALSDQASEADVSGLPTGRIPCDLVPPGGFALGSVSVHCVDGPPELEVEVPKSFTAEQMLVVGILCERGEAFVDPESSSIFACEDASAESILLHGTIPIQHGKDDENFNPDVSLLSIEPHLHRPWDPLGGLELSKDGCAGVDRDDPRLPQIDTMYNELRIYYPAKAREKGPDGLPEPLEISLHATDGEVDRRFTLFRPEDEGDDDGLLESRVTFHPPDADEVPRGGRVVQFFVTLRDQRGGFSLERYALCVR